MRINPPFAKYGILYFFCFQLLFLISCQKSKETIPWIEAQGISFQLWVRGYPETSTTAVAYGKIRNQRKESIEILGFETEEFRRIEWHETQILDNRVKMKKRSFPIQIDPENTWEFKANGDHLMMMERMGKWTKEKLNLTIKIKNLNEVRILVPVVEP